MQITLTAEESAFLVSLLSDITVKPAAPEAAQIVALVASIIGKLKPETEQ
jgi:hypothetical protein